MVLFLRLSNNNECRSELGSCIGNWSANGQAAHDSSPPYADKFQNLERRERHQPTPKTYALGPIKYLVRHQKVPGLDLFSQTAHSTECHNAPHPQLPQRSNIGSRRHLVRRNFVVQAMSRKNRDVEGRARGPWVRENGDGRRGSTPWRAEHWVREREAGNGTEVGQVR